MTCDASKERMIEVLYDEEIAPVESADFFRHLDGCPTCRSDFLDLTQTRQWLGSWEIEAGEQPPPAAVPVSRFQWWTTVQRLAASFLIVFGGVSILKGTGLWGDSLSVSERQLMELVTDVVVSKQTEQEHLFGRALHRVSDEVSLQQAVYAEDLMVRLQALEMSIHDASQERDRILQMLTVQ